jgi:hypothetical protein
MSLHRERTHPEYVEGCFGCKASTLELHPGDAAHMRVVSRKKWDAELNAYADARRQGIQPAGTSMKAIKDAHKASENLGKPYNGEKMAPAHRLANKKVANAMNKMGM